MRKIESLLFGRPPSHPESDYSLGRVSAGDLNNDILVEERRRPSRRARERLGFWRFGYGSAELFEAL
jgi:hypothetical protein